MLETIEVEAGNENYHVTDNGMLVSTFEGKGTALEMIPFALNSAVKTLGKAKKPYEQAVQRENLLF